jgi:hypothetical protein
MRSLSFFLIIDKPTLKGSDWHVYTSFCLSIDGLIMASGAPPTVATKYAFVQRVGRRLVSPSNACRSHLERLPLTRITNRSIPNCGSTSQSMCTWSGITSRSRTSHCHSSATSSTISFNRSSTPRTSTLRLYLGVQTTGYLHE